MAWTRFFRRRRWDEERARELEVYLQIETDENIARGMSAEEARHAAQRKLGNATQIRGEIYRMNTVGFVETLWQDFRYALRQFGRSPGFTAAAVLSLALGIGANTAIFSLLDQVLLRPLPVFEPSRLVVLDWGGMFYGPSMAGETLSYPAYRDIRDRNQVFSGVLGYHHLNLGVGYQGHMEPLAGEIVSGNYFEVLGVPAFLGRTFTPGDDRIPGAHPVAVLTYDFWADRFHADRNVLGQGILVNGTRFTIVGVSAKGFNGLEVGAPAKILLPMMMRNQVTAESWTGMFGLTSRRGRWVRVIARLKPGLSARQAKASLQPLFHSILEMEVQQKDFDTTTQEIRKQYLRSWIEVQPASGGHSETREQYQMPLRVLMGMVGLVLLIACANVANLLLARAASRRREIAVRLALGAGRGRILRQALAESILLALTGGVAGVLGAVWIDQALLDLLAAGDTPLGLHAAPDLRVLAFTLMLCSITGILFGLAPAIGAAGVDLVPSLKQQGRGVAAGASRLRRVLVTAQVFVSIVLLVGAGLFARSLSNLRGVDSGFRMDNVVAFLLDPSLNGYDPARRQRIFQDVLERLRKVPGVESASLGMARVLSDSWWCDTVTVEGYRPESGEAARPCHNAASPGYLATMGIPLVAGRDFSRADAGAKNKVALVNESFVRHYFGARSPLGVRFAFGSYPGTKPYIEIVGVIKDSKYASLRETAPPQTIVDSEQMEGAIFQANFYVKTHLAANDMYASIRRAVREVDPNLAIIEPRTLQEQRDLLLTTERAMASLANVFGALATILAAVGLYGLMSFHVAQRAQEIGIRIALGARRGNVAWLVMREALWLVGAGAVVALPFAWFLARFVRGQLYGIQPEDPWTMLAAMLLLAVVAGVAGYIPARRAARVDPIQALRCE